jgi:hypothetical protein
MRATIPKTTRQRPTQKGARRRGGPAPQRPEERERGTGGPQDSALYACRCGASFQARVTASVRCPHCGEPQAW